MRLISIFAVISIYGFSSCKPGPSSSSLKSLDNFTGASNRPNKCMADPSKTFNRDEYPLLNKINILGSSATFVDLPVMNLMSNVIVNIPKPIQSAFTAIDGQIVISDDAPATCAEIASAVNPNIERAKDLNEISSCLVSIPATSEHGRIVHVNFPPDIRDIHHNSMRVFGSFVVDLLPTTRPDAGALIRELMTNTSKSLVLDIVKSPVLDFNSLTYFFSAKDIETIKSRAKSNPELTAEQLFADLEMLQNGSSLRTQFEKMAFIESFDSYFCNNWSPTRPEDLDRILTKKSPLTDLNKMDNTRLVMQKLFPRTYKTFDSGMSALLKKLGGDDSNDSKTAAFALSDEPAEFSLGPSGRTQQQLDSPVWAGTKAFFGTLWDSTGGAASRAYSRYSERVRQGVDAAYSSGYSTPAALVRGTASGISNTYRDEVWNPVSQRTDRVFQDQLNGNGGNINAAFRNTLAVELLRPTGATAIAETTAVGRRFDGSTYKDGTQRASEFFGGVGALAGTTASVVGVLPRYGNTVVGGGTRINRNGALTYGADAAANSAVLQKAGVAVKYADKISDAFEPGARPGTLKSGDVLYRYSNSASEPVSSWFTRTTVANTADKLALPPGRTGGYVTKMVYTGPATTMVEGGVARMPKFTSSTGLPRTGGAGQVFVPNRELLGNFRPAGDPALIGGVVGGGTMSGQSIPRSSSSSGSSRRP